MNGDEHPGAIAVVFVFKLAAVLSVLGAIAIANDSDLTTEARIGLAFGGVLGAAMPAFFAYVLQYLAEIRNNTDQIPEFGRDD